MCEGRRVWWQIYYSQQFTPPPDHHARLGYDDSLDVFNVHGVGGFTGTILAAVFASPQFGGNQVGMSISTQLGVQTFAAVSTAVYTAIVSFIILKVRSPRNI
jgi:Amt family ammonium transporter